MLDTFYLHSWKKSYLGSSTFASLEVHNLKILFLLTEDLLYSPLIALMIVRMPARRATEFLLLPSLFLISLNATFFNYHFSVLFQIIEVVYIQAELNFRSYIETGSLTVIQISMINMNHNEGPGKAKPLDLKDLPPVLCFYNPLHSPKCLFPFLLLYQFL